MSRAWIDRVEKKKKKSSQILVSLFALAEERKAGEGTISLFLPFRYGSRREQRRHVWCVPAGTEEKAESGEQRPDDDDSGGGKRKKKAMPTTSTSTLLSLFRRRRHRRQQSKKKKTLFSFRISLSLFIPIARQQVEMVTLRRRILVEHRYVLKKLIKKREKRRRLQKGGTRRKKKKTHSDRSRN